MKKEVVARKKVSFSLSDAHTLSSQDELHRVNLVATVLSFTEEFVGDGGCVLRDIISRLDLQIKPWVKKSLCH